jgi:environmental stress-induced protein Ves
MKVIRAAGCRRTLWKNGGGATTEIAVSPPDASLDDFDWRVSMARVASDGPFSDFTGIDRSLAVVMGAALVLTIGDDPELELGVASDPARFAGDTPTSARLLAGEIVDLNVMTRRGRVEHELLPVRRSRVFDFDGYDVAVVVSASGDTHIRVEQNEAVLGQGDAALFSTPRGVRCEISPAAKTICYLVLLRDQAGCE